MCLKEEEEKWLCLLELDPSCLCFVFLSFEEKNWNNNQFPSQCNLKNLWCQHHIAGFNVWDWKVSFFNSCLKIISGYYIEAESKCLVISCLYFWVEIDGGSEPDLKLENVFTLRRNKKSLKDESRIILHFPTDRKSHENNQNQGSLKSLRFLIPPHSC